MRVTITLELTEQKARAIREHNLKSILESTLVSLKDSLNPEALFAEPDLEYLTPILNNIWKELQHKLREPTVCTAVSDHVDEIDREFYTDGGGDA